MTRNPVTPQSRSCRILSAAMRETSAHAAVSEGAKETT